MRGYSNLDAQELNFQHYAGRNPALDGQAVAPYLVEKKTPLRRKRVWLWIIAFVVTIVCLGLLIGLLVTKLNAKPSSQSTGAKGKGPATAATIPIAPGPAPSGAPGSQQDEYVAAGMYSQKRCDMLGPRLCGELRYMSVSLPAMRNELLQFWKTHGPDTQYGGFHGTLDRAGKPVLMPSELTNKGLVQQARHLWSFSTYYQMYDQADDVKAIADAQYKFLGKFLDPATDLFVFKVNRTGVATAKDFNLYANWFAILGLAKYAEVFKVQAAAEQALQTFQALDARCHDPVHLGYLQTRDAPALEQDAAGLPVAKGQNTHLHGLEALTQLYRVVKNDKVTQRAIEVIRVIVSNIFVPAPPDQYYALQYFTADWKPILSKGQTVQMVNHGHNLQFCWQLLDSLDTLATEVPQDLGATALQVALGGGEYSAKLAIKDDSTGFCSQSPVGAECSDTERVWWVQAEGMLALWKLYHLQGGSKVLHLKHLGETLTWVSNNQTDLSDFKEQFAVVNAYTAGGPVGNTLGEFGGLTDAKGSEWKASYHSMRSLMYLEAWMKQAAKNDGPAGETTDAPALSPNAG